MLHHSSVQLPIRRSSNHRLDQVERTLGYQHLEQGFDNASPCMPMGIKKGHKFHAPKTANDISKDNAVNEVFNQVSQSVLDKSMMQQAYPAESHEAEREREEAGTIDFPDEEESGDVPVARSDVKELEKAFDEEEEVLEQLQLPDCYS